MVLRKLAFSNFRVHKIRAALTLAAVALSVSLVVAVTSGYASVQAAAEGFLDKFIGTVDAQITRQNDNRGAMSEAVAEEVRKDPDVAAVNTRLETEIAVADPAATLAGRAAQVIGIKRPEDKRVDRLEVVAGGWFEGDSGDVAVVDQVAAQVLDLK